MDHNRTYVVDSDGSDDYEFSPKNAHVKNKWGSSSRNWSLWSAWESSLFKECTLFESKNATENNSRDIKTVINDVFKKHRLENFGWTPLTDDFTMLRVTGETNSYPFTQQIVMDAEQIIENVDTESLTYATTHQVKIVACAALAEIFQAVIQESDILIISGGYDFIKAEDKDEIPEYHLNYNKNVLTQVIRVPATQHGRLHLYEKIEQANGEKRYKFSYLARRGTTQRTVQRHLYFDLNESCRDVTQTLGYLRVRWDFPVPIVDSKYAFSLYGVLLHPDFKIPPLGSNPTRKNDEPFDRSCANYSSSNPEQKVISQSSEVFHSYLSKKGVEQNTKSRSSNKNDKKISFMCAYLVMLHVFLAVVGVFIAVNWLSDVCPSYSNEKQSCENTYNELHEYISSPFPTDHGSLLISFDNNPNPSVSSRFTETIKKPFLKMWAMTEPFKYEDNIVYGWWIKVTRTWINEAVTWIRANCNLECFFAKLGFPVNEILW